MQVGGGLGICWMGRNNIALGSHTLCPVNDYLWPFRLEPFISCSMYMPCMPWVVVFPDSQFYSNDFQFDCWCVIPLRFLGCAMIRNWMRTESFRPWQSFYSWIVDLICHEHTAHYNNCNSILANSILARSFRAAIWLTN